MPSLKKLCLSELVITLVYASDAYAAVGRRSSGDIVDLMVICAGMLFIAGIFYFLIRAQKKIIATIPEEFKYIYIRMDNFIAIDLRNQKMLLAQEFGTRKMYDFADIQEYKRDTQVTEGHYISKGRRRAKKTTKHYLTLHVNDRVNPMWQFSSDLKYDIDAATLLVSRALDGLLPDIAERKILTIWNAMLFNSFLSSESVHKAMLSRALRRIHAASGNQQLGEEVQKQIIILLSQSAALEQAKLHCEPEGRDLIGQIDAASETLQNTINGTHNGCQGAPDLVATLRQCNIKILTMLSGGATKASQNAAGLDPLDIFVQQARQLMYKVPNAPKQIAPQLEAIALLTFEIVKSMRDDPRDRPTGERFLQRYLPAADHCAEEYAKLVSANNTREDVLQAIAQGEEFFGRLHKAFEVELASMLANDSASFSAELNALEKLLRMSGH